MKQFLTITIERLFNGFLYAKGILSQEIAGEGKIMLVAGSVLIIVTIGMGILFKRQLSRGGWKLDGADRVVLWLGVYAFCVTGMVLCACSIKYIMYPEAYAVRELISLIITGR